MFTQYNNIDLKYNQLIRAIAEKLDILPTTNHKAGRIVYQNSDNKIYYNNGNGWISINSLEEVLNQINKSNSSLIKDDNIIIKDNNGNYQLKSLDNLCSYIIGETQYLIELEKIRSTSVEIGTSTNGVITQNIHKLSSYFPIHVKLKYIKQGDYEQEVNINNLINKNNAEVKWSIVKPYTKEQNAKIELVGKNNDVSLTERELMEKFAYGIQWQATVEGTVSPIRTGNLELHKTLPIQSGMKGCIWNRTDKIKYYLDANDWSKKVDGTDAVLTGEDGDICVRIPKFYGRCVVNGTTREVWISQYKLSNSWIEIPEMVIAAYKGILINGRWRSIIALDNYGNSGVANSNGEHYWTQSALGQSRSNYSRANMRTACRANGMELLNYEYYKWILYWLPVIEYNCFNSQADAVVNDDGTPLLDSNGYHQGMFGIGTSNFNNTHYNNFKGNTSSLIPLGFGISDILNKRTIAPVPDIYNNWHKGNTTWIRNISAGILLNNSDNENNTIFSYRGLFNTFGELWQNLDGIVCVGSNVYTTTNPELYPYADTDETKLELKGVRLTSNGYGGIHYSNSADQRIEIWPSALGGDEASGLYDNYMYAGSGTSKYTVLVGGGGVNGFIDGLACLYSYLGVTVVYPYIGGRAYQLL